MKVADMDLKIISAEKTVFEGQVKRVTLPGSLGSFSLLSDHAPLVSSLQKGIIEYEAGESTETVEINGGFVEVSDNVVTVCVE